MNNKRTDSWKLEITNEIDNGNGTWTLMFDADDAFCEWFKKSQGLKRWSQKRFQKIMLKAITEAVAREEGVNKQLFISDEDK